MGWKERLENAMAAPMSVPSNDADFCARKVLRGLGWSESRLPLLCSLAGCLYDENEPRMDTVRRVLDFVSGGLFSPLSPSRKFVLDVRRENAAGKCWDGHEDLLYLASVGKSLPGGLIILSRSKSGNAGRDGGHAYVLSKDETVPEWLLRPVSCLLHREDGCMVWRRNIEDLFRDMSSVMGWDIPSV